MARLVEIAGALVGWQGGPQTPGSARKCGLASRGRARRRHPAEPPRERARVLGLSASRSSLLRSRARHLLRATLPLGAGPPLRGAPAEARAGDGLDWRAAPPPFGGDSSASGNRAAACAQRSLLLIPGTRSPFCPAFLGKKAGREARGVDRNPGGRPQV